MRELVLILWSALITSGWWAVSIFKIDNIPVVVVFTIMLSVGMMYYITKIIMDNW